MDSTTKSAGRIDGREKNGQTADGRGQKTDRKLQSSYYTSGQATASQYKTKIAGLSSPHAKSRQSRDREYGQ